MLKKTKYIALLFAIMLGATANATVTFTQNNKTVASIEVGVGESATITVSGASAYSESWSASVSASSIATASMSGKTLTVQGKSVGTCNCTVTHSYKSSFFSKTKSEKATLAITVVAKEITVTPKAAQKVYGDVDPELTASVMGLASGQQLAYTVTRVEGEDVGTYDIVTSGPSELNGTKVIYETNTFTIVRREVSVTAHAASAAYGDPNPVFGYEVTGEGIVDGVLPNGSPIVLNGALSRVAGQRVKDSPYDITDGTLTNDNNPNYIVDSSEVFIDGEEKFTLTARPITIRADDCEKYAGEATPKLTYTIVSGNLVGDDQLVGTLTWNGDETVGEHAIVQDGDWSNDNYAVTFIPGKFVIKATTPIKQVKGADGVYEVEVDTTDTSAVVIGLGDTEKVMVPTQVNEVKGVATNQVIVVGEATNSVGEVVKVDITSVCKIVDNGNAGVQIVLNDDPNAAVEVTIDGKRETIMVVPELTDVGDASGEPLVVKDDAVDVGAKTIPGLTYQLMRSTTLGGAAESVASECARSTRVRLVDPMKGGVPSQAFYVIEVVK